MSFATKRGPASQNTKEPPKRIKKKKKLLSGLYVGVLLQFESSVGPHVGGPVLK